MMNVKADTAFCLFNLFSTGTFPSAEKVYLSTYNLIAQTPRKRHELPWNFKHHTVHKEGYIH